MSVPEADPCSKVESKVVVNGEAQPLADGASLGDLLAALDLTGRRVAVAVNREIIPRSAFGDARLVDGDRIEILEAVGGG